MDVELMQALTVDGDILPVIESEHRAWREAWDSDPLLGMSFEDWQWRRLVLFRKRLEEATESNAVIASAHWELCKRLEAAEKILAKHGCTWVDGDYCWNTDAALKEKP
jgi:hypothetical protein